MGGGGRGEGRGKHTRVRRLGVGGRAWREGLGETGMEEWRLGRVDWGCAVRGETRGAEGEGVL